MSSRLVEAKQPKRVFTQRSRPSAFNMNTIEKINDVFKVKTTSTNFIQVFATFGPEHSLIVISNYVGQTFSWASCKSPQGFENSLVTLYYCFHFMKINGFSDDCSEMTFVICLKHIKKVAVDYNLNFNVGILARGIVI